MMRASKGLEKMRSLIEVSLVGLALICGAGAQDSQQIPLKQGVSVQMSVASHAVEMRAADAPNAQVVAITADGKVYLGVKATDSGALSNLSEGTVYVKADSRAPYQKVLTVLDALRGKSVVLLTAPPENAVRQGIVPPYGVTLIVPM
jgi:biopolymer transport protein ExbD